MRWFKTSFAIWALLFFSTLSWAETRIRAMTGNISSGNKQSYDEGHGIRMFQGLKPDIAMVQEANFGDNSPRAIREFVDTAFGKEFHYYREPDGGIPNAIISRYPILESGVIKDPTINNRGIAWAKIDVPGNTKMWVFSMHFSHDGSGRRRLAAEKIVDFVMKHAASGDYVLLGGDANTRSRTEQAMVALGEVFSDKHVPVGSDGKPGTSADRSNPYDILLPNRALEKYHSCVEIVVGGGEVVRFPNGLVFDSRVFRPLSAVAPVRQGDSNATNMQHMPVIKDFVIP